MKNNWRLIKISDFAEVVTGGTPSTKVNEYWKNGTIPWLPSGACQDRKIYSADKFITESGLKNSSAKLMPKKTVVIALTGATTGKVGLLEFEATANQSVTGIIPNEKFVPEYLYFFLISIRKKILFDSYGGAQKHISQGYVKNIKLPLPDVPTQQRISKILMLALNLIDKRKAQIEAIDQLKESVFLEMFGDIPSNSMNWEIKKISEVVDSVVSGWSVGGDERDKKPNEIAVLKISAVTRGEFDPNEYKVIDKNVEIKKAIHPSKGSILFSRANTRELVGASAIIKEDYPDLILPDKLWEIIVNKDIVSTEYFKAIISHNFIRNEFSKNATGTSGSMLNISMEKFRRINIPVPPIDIQKKFTEIFNRIDIQKNHMEKSLIEIERNYNALMQRAFKGELFTQEKLPNV
ncbi:restriction endonuclease subunit S [Bacillus sp. FJAT-29814]|uniref:restriction endonuclease subunit S n=1 Tax=Bacillus sp. FJAT-29814 TaxID=1729688 RepID=UPI0008374BAC|nr:restriction endonuclease subunit S [Bacillus sp. FJAT-29814]